MEIEHEVFSTFLKVNNTFESLKKILLKLKEKWKEGDSYEPSFVDLPMGFINDYLNTLKLVLDKKDFSKKAVNGINQRIENFTRNFDNPFFETQECFNINALINSLMDCSRLLDEILKKYENQS